MASAQSLLSRLNSEEMAGSVRQIGDNCNGTLLKATQLLNQSRHRWQNETSINGRKAFVESLEQRCRFATDKKELRSILRDAVAALAPPRVDRWKETVTLEADSGQASHDGVLQNRLRTLVAFCLERLDLKDTRLIPILSRLRDLIDVFEADSKNTLERLAADSRKQWVKIKRFVIASQQNMEVNDLTQLGWNHCKTVLPVDTRVAPDHDESPIVEQLSRTCDDQLKMDPNLSEPHNVAMKANISCKHRSEVIKDSPPDSVPLKTTVKSTSQNKELSSRKQRLLCPHSKLKYHCPSCSTCPHGKLKSGCVHCKACPHGKLKKRCSQCVGCPHGKMRFKCARCLPCIHGKVKSGCKHCSGCPHKKMKFDCVVCKACPHGKAIDLFRLSLCCCPYI